MIQLSIVICTRNRPADLARCLTSLDKQTLAPGQVIVVDSSTEPLTDTCLKALTIATEKIYIHTRPGLTYQRNRGIERARGDIVCFFDDDVELEPTCLERLAEVFAHHPEYVGGMGAVTNINPYKNNLYHFWHTVFLLQRDYASGNFTLSGMPTHRYGTNQFGQTAVLGGCGMAFRRSVLEKEKFDEALERYAYLEDVDMSWRASRHGKMFFTPAARLAHFNSPENRDRISDNRAMYVANYGYHFLKNVYPTAPWRLPFFAWSLIGLLGEAVILNRTHAHMQGIIRGIRYLMRHRGKLPWH